MQQNQLLSFTGTLLRSIVIQNESAIVEIVAVILHFCNLKLQSKVNYVLGLVLNGGAIILFSQLEWKRLLKSITSN